MGPVARAGLGWAETIVPRAAWGFDTEAVVNVRVFNKKRIFEGGFASNAVRMMVMMIRAGRHGRRMLECNVLARGWFCSVRCVRVRACVSIPVNGPRGAERSAMSEGSAVREGSTVREGSVMRTGRSTSPSQSCATGVAAASAAMSTAIAMSAATAIRAATGVAACAAARGSARRTSGTTRTGGEHRTRDDQRSGKNNEFDWHGGSPKQCVITTSTRLPFAGQTP
jgi:hypothetical protein